MIVSIRSSFVKDTRKLNPEIKRQLLSIIKKLETTDNLLEFPNCKKLSGYKTAYRIRFHNYRIGFFYSNNSIELVRILDRKEVYRYFP
jgi:mRNA-degrading endonuclease RelE of RelBE toxin-antitoxin system